jgi:hypothetical protein
LYSGFLQLKSRIQDFEILKLKKFMEVGLKGGKKNNFKNVKKKGRV